MMITCALNLHSGMDHCPTGAGHSNWLRSHRDL
jgi:hypothetical protein